MSSAAVSPAAPRSSSRSRGRSAAGSSRIARPRAAASENGIGSSRTLRLRARDGGLAAVRRACRRPGPERRKPADSPRHPDPGRRRRLRGALTRRSLAAHPQLTVAGRARHGGLGRATMRIALNAACSPIGAHSEPVRTYSQPRTKATGTRTTPPTKASRDRLVGTSRRPTNSTCASTNSERRPDDRRPRADASAARPSARSLGTGPPRRPGRRRRRRGGGGRGRSACPSAGAGSAASRRRAGRPALATSAVTRITGAAKTAPPSRVRRIARRRRGRGPSRASRYAPGPTTVSRRTPRNTAAWIDDREQIADRGAGSTSATGSSGMPTTKPASASRRDDGEEDQQRRRAGVGRAGGPALDRLRARRAGRARRTATARPATERTAPRRPAPPSAPSRAGPTPTSVPSQPTTNSAGARRPSRAKVVRPKARGRRRGSGECVGWGSERGLGRPPGRRGLGQPSARWSDGRRGARTESRIRSFTVSTLTGRQGLPRRQRDDRRGRRRGDRVVALELAAAPGAQRPVEPDEPGAVRADAVQPRSAGRTDDPGAVDPSIARRAVRDRLDLGEHRLLGEVALVDLADSLLRPDDPVGEHGEREQDRGEDDDERRREVGRERVVAAGLHVPERPVRRGQPEHDPVDDRQLDAQPDDGVVEDRADGFADGVEDLVHSATGASVVRSVARLARATGGSVTGAEFSPSVTVPTRGASAA